MNTSPRAKALEIWSDSDAMPGRIERYQPPGRTATQAYRELSERKRRNNFYSRAVWRRLRALKLAQHPFCEDCAKSDTATPAEHVHHVKPVETHPALALVWSNLESLCQPCHNAKDVR